MQSILRINLVAILFFLASNFVFSREVSPVENIDKKAKIAVKYERDKTIFSVDSIEDKHYSYQWQQSADGETWEDIEGATQPQLEATELPAKAFIRARMDDGFRIIYTLTATPIRINGQNQVFSGCSVTWEASIPDNYKKNNPTDDEPVYLWYKWDGNVWTDQGMPMDEEDIIISFSDAAPKYKFVVCKTNDDVNKYNANSAISDDCDCIESAEKSLAQVSEEFQIDDKTHFLLKDLNDEGKFDTIRGNTRDTTICAGRKIKIELSIKNANIFGFSYLWSYSTDNFTTWTTDGNPSQIYESGKINENTKFKCEVYVNNCPVMEGKEPTFTVNVYDMQKPKLKKGEIKGVEENYGVYYTCANCKEGCGTDSIIELVVDTSDLNGCKFLGSKGPNKKNTYICELEAWKWNATLNRWEESSEYTKKINEFDNYYNNLGRRQTYTRYDRITKGYHDNKRHFRFDTNVIKEDSIKVCIHVIDSCTWAENKALDAADKKELWEIGMITDTIVIAKRPIIKDSLAEIAKGAKLKAWEYDATSGNFNKTTSKDLPLGGKLGDCENLKTIDKMRVFLQLNKDAILTLRNTIRNMLTDTLYFSWWEKPLETLLNEGKIENLSGTVRFSQKLLNDKYNDTKTELSITNDDLTAADSLLIDTTIIRSMVEGLSFDVIPGWCDMLKRKYGPTITEIGVRGSSYHCRDTLDTIAFDTLRATEQVKVIPLIGCENATQQYNTKETAYRVCQGEPFVLSFSADYMIDKNNPASSTRYHVLIEHTWETENGTKKTFTNADGNNIGEIEHLKVLSNNPTDDDSTVCNGVEAWWNGAAINCKRTLVYEEADAGYHTYIVYVATNKCETAGFAGCAFPTTYDIKQYIENAENGCDPCGYTWDIDTIVVAVGRKPKAPKIAMVSSDYFVDVEIDPNATPEPDTTTVFKTWDGNTEIAKDKVEEFIQKINYEDKENADMPADGILLYDKDDKQVVARTKDTLKSGDIAWKICFLELEQGDAMTCDPTTTEYLNRTTPYKQATQRTFNYEWQRKVANKNWETVGGIKYYANYTTYKDNTLTLYKFDSLLQPDLGDDGLVYYRLKMSDCCGNDSYSNILTISSVSSEPRKPIIGFDTTTLNCPKDTSVTYQRSSDGKDVKVCYDTLKWVCAGANPDLKIELANVGDFDQNTIKNDPFKFKWEYRSKKRPETGAITWDDADEWKDITDANRLEQTGSQAGARLKLTENYQAGYVYQYRVTSYFSSDEEAGTLPASKEDYRISDTVTVMVYKEITKDINEMKKDGMTIPDDNQMSILGDTIHRKFTPVKELTLRITNPDKKEPITYQWYVGKWDANETTDPYKIKWILNPIGDATSNDDLAQYYIAAKPDNTPTLKITQMPADCTAIYYKVVMNDGCGEDIEHVFKVVANKSRTDIKQVCIGIGNERYSTDPNSTCTRDDVSNYLYNEIDKPTDPIRVCYQTELAKLCGGATLGDIIKLANHKEFNQNTIVSDKYHFVWQTRSADRKGDGSDTDWNDDDWTNITDPYEYDVTQVEDNTKGINDTKLDYTTTNASAPTYDAGKAYQYRLLVYTDSMAVDENGTPLTDVKEIKNVLESNIITILVNKKIEKTTNEAEKIGCLGDKNGHKFTVKFNNVDDLECTYTWQAKKNDDAEWSGIDENNKSDYLIQSVPTDANLIISNMPDNETVVYTYKVTVKSTPCNDEFSQEFTLRVTSSLKIVGDIEFKDEDGVSAGNKIDVCKNKDVTVVTKGLGIRDGSNPFNLEYYFLAKEEEETPTPEERKQAGLIEGTSSSKDVPTNTDISNTINFVANETGYIWLRLVDNCNTEQWTNPIRLVVKPLPQTPTIKCNELDNTDRIVCLNDTFLFSYDKTGINDPDNKYTWKVQSKVDNKDYCKILKAEANGNGGYDEADGDYWENSDKIRIVWYSNGDNPSTVADAVFLDVYNSDTKCDNTSDKYNLNICGEKLLPTLDIIRKDTTHILIALAGDDHKWFQWGYTDKQGNDYYTNWHPYHYWRYTYDDTTTLYRWERQAWAGKIDPDNKVYWVKSLNVDDWERSYCRDRAKKSIWGKGNKTGKETKQYNYHFFVKTQSDVQNTQKIPIWIDNPKREVVHLYLISPMGVMVAQKQLPAEETIETSLPATFSSGIYFLHVQVGDERTTIKIRIQ